jgi:hypothetical protein
MARSSFSPAFDCEFVCVTKGSNLTQPAFAAEPEIRRASMIRQSDLDHHIMRESQHREKAAKTNDQGARKAHLEMAEGHAQLAAAAKKSMDRPKVMTTAEFEASLKPS